MNAEFVDGVRHKLENIISGHRINPDDADWLRAILHRTVTSRALSAPDNAEVTGEKAVRPRHSCETDMLSPCPACNADAGYANPTPAARVSVSDEDLRLCEETASYLGDMFDWLEEAAAIRRLVQAVTRKSNDIDRAMAHEGVPESVRRSVLALLAAGRETRC